MESKRVTVSTISEKKASGVPITMLTAYDYTMAGLVDQAGIDMILVGDSLGNVVLGYESTLPVTVDDMIHHGAAVCRGVRRAMVVIDMPFMSYQISAADAVKNAGRIMKETGAQAVKLEGGTYIIDAVKMIIQAGIPVVGHLGLTPQSVNKLGGFKVQGKDELSAQKLLDDAKALAEVGVCAIVLECVPAKLAAKVAQSIDVPIIGIGAGNGCDGQVLVLQDMLGIQGGFTPKFVRKFAALEQNMLEAITEYRQAVVERSFPAQEHTFAIDETVLDKLY